MALQNDILDDEDRNIENFKNNFKYYFENTNIIPAGASKIFKQLQTKSSNHIEPIQESLNCAIKIKKKFNIEFNTNKKAQI